MHTVRLMPQGRVIRVRPDQSVLDAALEAGINLLHSCKSGHCASCRAELLQGTIDYPRGAPLGLTAEEAASGGVLLCQAQASSDLVVATRAVAHLTEVEIRTLPCRIERLVSLAPDVMQVWLRLPATERLEFRPGQYLDVLLDGGRRRSFSIASPPHDAALIELHVRRVPGGGFTSQVFDALRVGALLRIEGPVGQFVLREASTPLLLIAGGTGFAPLKSIIRHVLERGAARKLHFFWGARAPIDLYEDALVRRWTQEHPSLYYTGVLSEAQTMPFSAEARVSYATGWVHECVLQHCASFEPFDVYAAGPPAMIEAIRASFPAHGLAADRLHFDSFDYAPA